MKSSAATPTDVRSSTTPLALDQLLVQLRQSPTAQNNLWNALLLSLQGGEADLATALLDWYGIATITDAQWPHVQLLPPQEGLAASNEMLWVMLGDRCLLLCEDPWTSEATLALRRSPKTPSQLALARPGQVQQLRQLAPPSAVAKYAQTYAAPKVVPSASLADLSPVVQFVDQSILRAYREGASDIHFETHRTGMVVKYRLDGVMSAGDHLSDLQRAEEVVSRIKVMAQLDITERRRPQDGRIHWSQVDLDSIDLRVSIMPSIFGEDAVLRLLDKAQLRHSERTMSLDVLGFDTTRATTIRALASMPHGMLLVTGPTGSGKTTTIYASLCEINDGLEKIVTIEDPVEYELPGILQIPVNEAKGLTFATGLRSILRHDPDKILVGEIRDAETAEIAVQSSLTGHLVFTTVHANSLFDVLGRFQHFGIEPFALASALNGVVVQRLMRKLCPHCSSWRELTSAEVNKLNALQLQVPQKLPRAQGCEHCRHTGYKGRFVLAEVHELSDAVRDLMVRRASMLELKSLMYRDPSNRLIAQAIHQVEIGNTTLEEVMRVVGLV